MYLLTYTYIVVSDITYTQTKRADDGIPPPIQLTAREENKKKKKKQATVRGEGNPGRNGAKGIDRCLGRVS